MRDLARWRRRWFFTERAAGVEPLVDIVGSAEADEPVGDEPETPVEEPEEPVAGKPEAPVEEPDDGDGEEAPAPDTAGNPHQLIVFAEGRGLKLSFSTIYDWKHRFYCSFQFYPDYAIGNFH